jgi:2-aminophenol/2-amino-5-chlorophenol 1,6-dioxygenase alpha subunit
MIVGGLVVPGKPHPLLAAEQNEGWAKLREAFGRAREFIESSGAERLVLYSTQWHSIIGHQIQADPEPEWVHVDQEWHDLGSMPYKFRMDTEYAAAYESTAQKRGLQARQVAYRGFPIDTGTIVALKLLNPENKVPASVVSCNMYSDRAETLVLGKAAADAIALTEKRTVAVAVTALSNRLITDSLEPKDDRISSLKDDEWNRKILELLGEGRLEDVSQLARQFSKEANGDQKMKAIWWLAAVMGQHNRYDGEVLEYKPTCGTGAAVVSLTPSARAAQDQEFDEDDVDVYGGDRSVLDSGDEGSTAVVPPESSAPPVSTDADDPQAVRTDAAPKPVGAYPHARRVRDMLYLSGIGPRQPQTDEIPGGPIRDGEGNALDYDVAAQTKAVIENIKVILEAAGASLEKVVDVTCFLVDMDRDFAAFNKVYAEYFAEIGPTRTTVEVRALPTPIAVELKVVALP